MRKLGKLVDKFFNLTRTYPMVWALFILFSALVGLPYPLTLDDASLLASGGLFFYGGVLLLERLYVFLEGRNK